ncbi:MAG: SsrA-binding protein [Actinobacteria bacterium]|nr:SsrA-binding protein [Actinomycetota bacterium]
MKSIVNRKARFEYTFIDTYIAGICLFGTEVKAIKDGKASMVDTYCIFDKGELWVKGLGITPGPGSFQHEALRDKKLLLRKKELKKLSSSLDKGLTIIPVKIFVDERNRLKMEIALAKGKKLYDKRESIKERDVERDLRRMD